MDTLIPLLMPEGSQELVEAHAAAERGDGYTSHRQDAGATAFFIHPLFFAIFCFLVYGGAWLSRYCFQTDMSLFGWIYAILTGGIGIGICNGGIKWIRDVRTYIQLAFGAEYEHRRMPEEEELLKDKLTVVAAELSKQVGLYESLRAEVEFQDRMAEVGLPADLDIERCRQIAHALHDDLAPKLAQLSVLIARRNRRVDAKEVDLVALHEALGAQHRDLITTLKAQREMGGDPAVQLLHDAVRVDVVNAELGDTAAAARELAARRRQRA